MELSSIFCFFIQSVSLGLLPSFSKLIMTHLEFPYPLAISTFHTIAISMCLWFWTILGMFKPRTIQLSDILLLSFMSSVNTVIQFRLLFQCSLLHYIVIRFVPLCVSASPKRCLHTISFATGVAYIFSVHPTNHPLIIFAYIFSTMFDSHGFPHNMRKRIFATDLQLQLAIKSFSAIWLCIGTLIFESGILGDKVTFSSFSIKSIHEYFLSMQDVEIELEDSKCFLIYSTALLAYFKFVAVRVAQSKLHPSAFSAAFVSSSFLIVLVHFWIYESPEGMEFFEILLFLCYSYHIIRIHDHVNIDYGERSEDFDQEYITHQIDSVG